MCNYTRDVGYKQVSFLCVVYTETVFGGKDDVQVYFGVAVRLEVS